jgi:hypothetical protein
MEDLKHCSGCDESLSLDCFYKAEGKRDGFQPWCKSCKSEYDKSHQRRRIMIKSRKEEAELKRIRITYPWFGN